MSDWGANDAGQAAQPASKSEASFPMQPPMMMPATYAMPPMMPTYAAPPMTYAAPPQPTYVQPVYQHPVATTFAHPFQAPSMLHATNHTLGLQQVRLNRAGQPLVSTATDRQWAHNPTLYVSDRQKTWS
eukprot:CAMPEP_0175816592 /NCGR_PEP_ID=MMETSP0107_2-20121207/6575_1 /TAXON_ID=195067 ORGANISM="Goniomonas pacifica, Strain CCMP1869" /NCGR_SAMPLE_ID=MMETSP0107_2 /ASSEMBLY_ACC=CAM_ASM_000203 /LENGTH=128 /DNA_ID=CAMNT_0017128697 /DNA_START=6 /DNA_END=392 /DNA_ORIENTATION=-